MIFKILLWINLSLLYVHEMDAVHTMEWKMMAFFNRISDETAHRFFTAAHFFIFLAIFWLIEYRFEYIFWFANIFLIIHFFMHISVKGHSENRMNSVFSGTIITLMFIVASISVIIKLI